MLKKIIDTRVKLGFNLNSSGPKGTHKGSLTSPQAHIFRIFCLEYYPSNNSSGGNASVIFTKLYFPIFNQAIDLGWKTLIFLSDTLICKEWVKQ